MTLCIVLHVSITSTSRSRLVVEVDVASWACPSRVWNETRLVVSEFSVGGFPILPLRYCIHIWTWHYENCIQWLDRFDLRWSMARCPPSPCVGIPIALETVAPLDSTTTATWLAEDVEIRRRGR